MAETVRLLMGPVLQCRKGNDRLLQKYGAERIIGLYFHIVRFNSAYKGLNPWEKCLIDGQIEYLMDYYPWLHNLDKEDRAYSAISDLRRVKNCKSTFKDLDQALKDAFGDNVHMCWAVSRAGLITSWSSKVSGFLSNTELGAYVGNVERGLVYVIDTREDACGKIEELVGGLIDELLYDSYVDCLPPDSMLQSQPPAPPEGLNRVVLPDDFYRRSLDDRLKFFVDVDREWDVNLGEENSLYLAAEYYRKNRFEDSNSSPKERYSFTESELGMFGQVNSDHCRHIVFNSRFVIDGEHKRHTLFEMIKNTYNSNKEGVISAYKDNGAIIEGPEVAKFSPDPLTNVYRTLNESCHMVIKAETHNHPTTIDPYNGAATGVGGEIRDEAACGTGSKPVCGFVGLILSNLSIPGFVQPWEDPYFMSLNENYAKQRSRFNEDIASFYSAQKPSKPLSSSINIIINAPIGSSHYSNEFGRPSLAGFFRTYTESATYKDSSSRYTIFGYHKPVMLCGGMGVIRPQNVYKKKIRPGDLVVVFGEPAILVGLGGGSMSSKSMPDNPKSVNSSVQRANAEAERICQCVIDTCCAYGNDNPLISIHDVGAGGLSNALPELVHDSNVGARINLRKIPLNHQTMSPMEILCTESQERYVAAVRPENIELFKAICLREKCNFAVVGTATEQKSFVVYDELFDNYPVEMSLDFLFGSRDRDKRHDVTCSLSRHPLIIPPSIKLRDIAYLILKVPAVASKSFLITIGDRSVTGLVARDQMVGPWQVPVSDAAVVFQSYSGYKGSAMALGERPLISLIDPAASARMSVCEALTNILSADIESLKSVRLSANWMADAGTLGMISDLYRAVEAIGMDLCPSLGISIPVGKDSMSMSLNWKSKGAGQVNGDITMRTVVSPVTVAISAYAPVRDVRRCTTPQLADDNETTVLMFIDLACGNQRLGGSCLYQIFNTVGQSCPDVCNVKETLIPFSKLMKTLRDPDSNVDILSYHDRSDGGLFSTLVEMCFSGNKGCSVDISSLGSDDVASLFNEELGVLIQLRSSDAVRVSTIASYCGLDSKNIHVIGVVDDSSRVLISRGSTALIDESIVELYQAWSQTSYHIQSLRGNKKCADSEYNAIPGLLSGKGLSIEVGFDMNVLQNPPIHASINPLKVAVLRENGSNGFMELAYCFQSVGFEVHDVMMSDFVSGKVDLSIFSGIGLPGGFSNGDVLGSGSGWAKSILVNKHTRCSMENFLKRPDKFAIGICNGCQLLAHLREIVPGADSWPLFVTNESGLFEARVCRVKIEEGSNSIFLKGMGGSIITAPVAHGEGRVYSSCTEILERSAENPLKKITAFTYVDNDGKVATSDAYPYNPSGTPFGIAGVTSDDGRVLAIMPHPERYARMYQNTWGFEKTFSHAASYSKLEWGPWIKLFRNAYEWACEVSN